MHRVHNYEDFDDDLNELSREEEYRQMVRTKRAFRSEEYSQTRIDRAKAQKKFKPKRRNKYEVDY